MVVIKSRRLRLTPADEAGLHAGWRSCVERLRQQTMQVKTFAEHPEITGTREVDLEKRQQSAPHLKTATTGRHPLCRL